MSPGRRGGDSLGKISIRDLQLKVVIYSNLPLTSKKFKAIFPLIKPEKWHAKYG